MSSNFPLQDIENSHIDAEIAISASNLSKVYQIYERPEDRLKQSILPRFQRIFGRDPKNYYREFWALKDISFEIKKGETVAIIGRNGAGKSTLLQMICGTLHPSSGEVERNGRVAALLELGSGFNPEFTGRENVYLNASILGLTTEEINSRFHEIEEFADIGEFINQPVKTYSSGMYLRLAFAVIAHVDADILIVDEALAVGDVVFAQKCMRFIRRFQRNGTLLLVSHDMASVQNLCERAVWLSHGKIKATGSSKSIGEEYLRYTLQQTYGDDIHLEEAQRVSSSTTGATEIPLNESTYIDYEASASIKDNLDAANGWQTGVAEIKGVSIEHMDGGQTLVFKGGEFVRLKVHAVLKEYLARPIIGFVWRDRLGQVLFGENTLPFTSVNPVNISTGQQIRAEFDFYLPMLPNGQYVVTAALADGDVHEQVQHHWLHDALVVTVSSSKVRSGLVGIPFKAIRLTKDP